MSVLTYRDDRQRLIEWSLIEHDPGRHQWTCAIHDTGLGVSGVGANRDPSEAYARALTELQAITG